MSKRFKGLVILLLVLILLVPIRVYAQGNWVKDGDKVYVDDENVYLSAAPHTLGSSGWVEFELLSKQYEGNIDVVWGLPPASGVTPSKPQVWADNVPHIRYRHVQVEVQGQVTFDNIIDYEILTPGSEPSDIGNDNNTKLVRVILTDEDSPPFKSPFVIAFNTHVQHSPTSATFYYNYDGWMQEEYIEYYPDWKPLPLALQRVTLSRWGMSDWHFVQLEAPIQRGVLYRARCWVEIPFAGFGRIEGKYFWGVKPSGETLQEAIASGHAYFIDPWWNSSWSYRKKLVFNNAGGGTLTDVPVAVLLDNTNFDFSKAQSDGDDIRFVDSDDTTPLYHFAETWEGASNQAIFRVRVPQIDASDTDFIYMYYGNDTAANGEDMESVFSSDVELASTHKGSSSNLLVDATSNSNDGVISGAVWTQLSSSLWVLDFDGTDDVVTITNHASLAPGTDSWTLKFWFTMGTRVDSLQFLSQQYTGDTCALQSDNGSYECRFRVNKAGVGADSILGSTTGLNDGDWHQVVVVRNEGDSKLYLYIDGASDATAVAATNTTGQNLAPSYNLEIGEYSTYDHNGYIALFTTHRAAWDISDVAGSYDYEKHLFGISDGFITFESEETIIIGPPTGFTLTGTGEHEVTIEWVKDPSAASTEIRRSSQHYPMSPTDGDQIYSGSGTSVVDDGPALTERIYYYRAWSKSLADTYSSDYAEGRIGGTGMLTLALVGMVLALTTGAFVWKNSLLAMVSVMGWLVLTFYLINQAYPAENAYLQYAVAVVCISMALVMAVKVIMDMTGRASKPLTSSDVQREHRRKVQALTKKRERPWYYDE